MVLPKNDKWCSIKCLFPFFKMFIKIFQELLRKITPSWEHISTLSLDMLNSHSGIVIQVINWHHYCGDGRLQTEQIYKGVSSTVFISLRKKGWFVRQCKFLREKKNNQQQHSIQKTLHLFFSAEFQCLVFFHTIGNYPMIVVYQTHFWQLFPPKE